MKPGPERKDKIFALRAPNTDSLARKLFALVQNPLEKLLFLDRLNRLYTQVSSGEKGSPFLERVLDALNVTYDVAESDVQSVPTNGSLIVVANHPFGGIEGIILASLIRKVRLDTKILGNYLLRCIPEMHDLLIYVDPFGTKDSVAKNVRPLREAISWVEKGHALVVFPAGAVSHLQLRNVCVADPRWHTAVSRIIRKTRAPALPVFVEGMNSTLFQLAGLVHP